MPLKVLLFCAAIAAAGCGIGAPSKAALDAAAADTNFNELAYAPFRKPGTTIVTGQAFLTTRGGDVRSGAGRTVRLDPATAHSARILRHRTAIADAVASLERRIANERESVRERVRRLIDETQGRDLDPLAAEFTRTTVADADGRFRFESVPPGSYLVTTVILWDVPTESGPEVSGGGVIQLVTVPESGSVDVVLTQ